jgi:hypothetical protein
MTYPFATHQMNPVSAANPITIGTHGNDLLVAGAPEVTTDPVDDGDASTTLASALAVNASVVPSAISFDVVWIPDSNIVVGASRVTDDTIASRTNGGVLDGKTDTAEFNRTRTGLVHVNSCVVNEVNPSWMNVEPVIPSTGSMEMTDPAPSTPTSLPVPWRPSNANILKLRPMICSYGRPSSW